MKILPASIFCLTSVSCLIPLAVKAQIIPDNSLGEESSVITPVETETATVDLIEGGAVRGSSLFHSFQEFIVYCSTIILSLVLVIPKHHHY